MDLSFDRPAIGSITTVLTLPTLDLLMSQENLRITVTTSLCLDLPSQFSGIESVNQLLDLVKESHLWIARTGSCCFDVSVTVNGDSLQKDKEKEAFSLQVKQSKARQHLPPAAVAFKLTVWHSCGIACVSDSNATAMP
jgi:hypothetical protein